MFSQAQALYLTEVLGVSTSSYRRPKPDQDPAASTEILPGLVLTKPLNEAEAGLLQKILHAIHALNWIHIVCEDLEVGRFPDRRQAKLVLLFDSNQALGLSEIEDAKWCVLPSLGEMVGNSMEVTELKKKVWADLKRFKA